MANPVVILTLHHVHPGRDRLTVPPELFDTALTMIRRRRRIIAYDRFKQWMAGEAPVPAGCVLLTFDDGYLDNYLHAFPILQRHAAAALIFPITGLVAESDRYRQQMPAMDHKALLAARDPAGFLNTAEIRAMHASGLVDVASHSVSHLYFRGIEAAAMRAEFDASLAFIRQMGCETAPHGFCWPGGQFDDEALAAIRQSPYELAFSTVDGPWRRGDDPYTIRRVDVSSYSGDPADYLARLRKKLFIYGTPVVGHWYSGFKALRSVAGRRLSALFRGR